MNNVKIINIHPHNMDENMIELNLDYIEKKYRSSRRDDPIRSREFIKKELKIIPHKNIIISRNYVLLDGIIIGDSYTRFIKKENDDNPDKIWSKIFVLPEYRKKGIGSKLFLKVKEFAMKFNRTTIETGLFPIDGDDGPNFLKNRGILPKLNEKVSRLYKDNINWDFINSTEKILDIKLSKYRIETLNAVDWSNKLISDDEYAKEYADFSTEIDALIPMEDIERNQEIFTIDDVRRWAEDTLNTAELWSEIRIFMYHNNRIIASSTTFYPNDPPIEDVATGLTGVRKAYQRQGIATYLKIRMIRYYIDEHPEFKYIYTENAASNDGMLSINISLGFKPKYDWQMYQGKITD